MALAIAIQLEARAASPIAFGVALNIPVAGSGIGGRIIAGDFDGDGHLDLVTTPSPQGPESYPNVDGVNVLYGDGTGGFPETRTFLAGESLSGLAAADFNGDGRLDLVTTESFGIQPVAVGLCANRFARAPVFIGTAPGGFASRGCLKAADHPGAVAAGDFDGDGIADLLIVNSSRYSSNASSRAAHFYKGIGNGRFNAGRASHADHADDVVAADFNGDHRMDFAIASPSYTHIYLGAGNGGFVYNRKSIAGRTERIAVGDINGDGIPDIAAIGSSPTDPKDDLVRIAYGNGNGRFRSGPSLPAGAHPTGVAVADLDKDGHADVIVANHLSDDISIHVSVDGQSFLPEQRVAAGNGPVALAVADFTEDGYPDIAVANDNPENDGTLGDGGVTLLVTEAPAP
jgi:hypothetical protein